MRVKSVLRKVRGGAAGLLVVSGVANGQGAPPPVELPVSGASYSILDYGADASGVRDSSPAFERIMQSVGTNRHFRICLPPGSYRLNKPAVIRALNNDTYYGLHIQGAGENVTELLVDNPEGGLAFRGTRITRMGVIVSDLALVALRSDAGTALFFDTANAGVENMRQFTVRNVAVRGVRFDRGFFNTAVHVRNAWYALLQNVDITQQYQTEIGSEKYAMEYGILLEDCYSPLVADCRVLNGKYGLVQRAVNMFPEDGIVRGSYFVGNVDCIVIDMNKRSPAWPEPGFHIEGCHVNYRDRGIVIKGLQQANISHTLFYCHDRSGTRWFQNEHAPVPGGDEKTRRPYEPRDIDVEYAANIIIDGNIFTEPANLNRVGVRIGPASGHILLSGNQFNMSGTAIKNESSEPSYSSGNIFSGKPNWAAQLVPYDDKPCALQIADFKPQKTADGQKGGVAK
jgi:hypothetical protein